MPGELRDVSQVAAEFSNYDGDTQGACRLAPGKSNVHSSCEVELGIDHESLQVK